MRLRLFFIILISYVGIETMYSVNVSQVATVSFEGGNFGYRFERPVIVCNGTITAWR